MSSGLRSTTFWSILLSCGIGLVFCCRGRDPLPRLPADEDALVSYLQAADALARLLTNPPPALKAEDRAEAIAAACAELEEFQARADALSAERIAQLSGRHGVVVAEAGRSWEALARSDARRRLPAGMDWQRVEAAYRLCRDLHGAKR